jgi:hypothetical protein
VGIRFDTPGIRTASEFIQSSFCCDVTPTKQWAWPPNGWRSTNLYLLLL